MTKKGIIKMTALSTRYYSRYEVSDSDQIEMYDVFKKYYDNTDYQTFINDLNKKTGVHISRRKDTNAIVGFSTVLKMVMRVNGKKIIGIFSGDTILEKEFWGTNPFMNKFFVYFIKQAIIHPFTPLYWFLISKGYKTYLLLANNWLDHYPCFNKEQPELAEITKNYCSYLYKDYYDPEKELLDFGEDYQHLKAGVAEINEDMCRKNPRISFFVEKNTGWAKGTELPCVGKATWKNVLYHIIKPIRKFFHKNKKRQFVHNKEITKSLGQTQ